MAQTDDLLLFETPRVRVVADATTGFDIVTLPNPKGAIAAPRRNVRGVAQFGFVTQHRHTTQGVTLEFPRGGVNADEPHEVGAARELREETGYDVEPDRGIDLGALWPDTGILRSDVRAFLFTVTEDPGTCDADQSEQQAGIGTIWLSVGEVMASVADGRIVCGMTLSTWAKIAAHGLHRMP